MESQEGKEDREEQKSEATPEGQQSEAVSEDLQEQQDDVLDGDEDFGGDSRSFADAVAQGQVGLGVDIVDIERMKRILKRTPYFAKKVYSEDEQKYCNSKANPAVHYATRFAAKEAVLKALGTGFSEGIGPLDVEVGRNAKGRPYTVLRGKAKEIADSYGVLEIPLSLSYTHGDAIACAMAITSESIKAAEERTDPMEELAKQFKEARSWLDEMDTKATEEEQGDSDSEEEPENTDSVGEGQGDNGAL